MTPQELKNSILQLAIQGKLVEQRPEEGTAEELFQKIQEEKKRLIAEKKIKKEKPLPEITEDEKPFDIPDSWKWVRFGNIVNVVSARRVHQSDWKTNGVPFYRAREIAKLAEDGFVDNELFISEELFEDFSRSGIPKPGDLMVTAVGTLGKCYVVQDGDRFYYKDASVICLENYARLFSKYLQLIMQSEMLMKQIRSNSSGTTVATLTMVRMVQYLLPLPPLAEQKRIVAKIEEMLPYIDRYEKAWSKLEQFNKRFPEDMKKSLLQYAIEGKLVEQRPEEGTAEELFQKIQEEKQRLIREKKIKKEKPLPEITEEEKPFDIPESWKWVRLGEIVTVLGGKRIPAGRQLTVENTGYKYIRVSDMRDGTVLTEGLLYVPKDIYPSIARYVIHKEDIYITVAGTIGRVGKIPPKIDGANLTENADRLVFSMIEQNWLIKCLESNVIQIQIANVTTKVGQPKLAIKRIQELVIPLPPLAEQKRIVEKLEQLLPLCDRLK